jgi:hypothetical protein
VKNISAEEEESSTSELTGEGLQLIGKNYSAFENRIMVEMDVAFKIEVFIPPQLLRSNHSA